MERTVSRRRLLALAGSAGAGSLAGCLGGEEESDDAASSESADDADDGLSARESDDGPSDLGATPDEPLPHRELGTLGSRELVVHGVLIGEDAVDKHVDADASNEPPADGDTYLLVDIEVHDPTTDGSIDDLGLTVALETDDATYERRDGAACRGDETAQLGSPNQPGNHRETRCLAVPESAVENGVIRLSATDEDATRYVAVRDPRSGT